jgi:hypothetical protein
MTFCYEVFHGERFGVLRTVSQVFVLLQSVASRCILPHKPHGMNMMRRSTSCILSHPKAHNAGTNSHQNSHQKAKKIRTKISTYGGAADFRSAEGGCILILTVFRASSTLTFGLIGELRSKKMAGIPCKQVFAFPRMPNPISPLEAVLLQRGRSELDWEPANFSPTAESIRIR